MSTVRGQTMRETAGGRMNGIWDSWWYLSDTYIYIYGDMEIWDSSIQVNSS